MKRIDSPNRAVDLFGAGKDGFKSAVPGVAPATELNALWFNGIQEEIVRTIEAAGLVPSAAVLDQLSQAIRAIAGQAAADLAGSAPDLLNTIQELANAIANDPSFAVTMANALAGKERKFDTGTRMLFQQSAAPVGWTKLTAHDNKALRVVNGAAGSGGTRPFTQVFGAISTANTDLTFGSMFEDNVGNQVTVAIAGGSLPTAHSHNIDLSVQYVDIIIASKD